VRCLQCTVSLGICCALSAENSGHYSGMGFD
jgi:hypothetical protein